MRDTYNLFCTFVCLLSDGTYFSAALERGKKGKYVCYYSDNDYICSM